MQIRISPEKMRNIAGEQVTLANDIQKIVTALDGVETRVKSAWRGVAGEQVVSLLQTSQSTTQKLAEEMQESVRDLQQIADAFESADNLNGAPIASIGFIPANIADVFGGPIRPLILDLKIFQNGEIRIIPDEVREAATLCKREVDELLETKSSFRVTVNRLRDSWEGNACNKYMEGAEELTRAFDDVAESLQEMAEKMIQAANRYEELDNSL